jgi:CHAT domain-containing protein
MVVVNPRYPGDDDLPWSAKEATELGKLLAGVEFVSPADRAAVDQLLNRVDLQIVHFTGHGTWDSHTNADLSTLRLENDEEIPAMSFARNALGTASPILYLNACTAGRIGQVLGRSGGFAANCLDAGWSGVIAPYWKVYDPKAFEFSIALYTKLKLGRAVGEALQEIRRDNPDDPTALAYSYFGDPWARVLFPDA